MRALLGAFLALASTSSFADAGRLIVESDTGIVFADLACEAEAHEVFGPEFYEDMFGYLSASVRVEITCLTNSGETLVIEGQDEVPFLTLRFDASDQSWYSRTTKIATRGPRDTVVMNDALAYSVSTSGDPTHVAFRVEVRELPVP